MANVSPIPQSLGDMPQQRPFMANAPDRAQAMQSQVDPLGLAPIDAQSVLAAPVMAPPSSLMGLLVDALGAATPDDSGVLQAAAGGWKRKGIKPIAASLLRGQDLRFRTIQGLEGPGHWVAPNGASKKLERNEAHGDSMDAGRARQNGYVRVRDNAIEFDNGASPEALHNAVKLAGQTGRSVHATGYPSRTGSSVSSWVDPEDLGDFLANPIGFLKKYQNNGRPTYQSGAPWGALDK